MKLTNKKIELLRACEDINIKDFLDEIDYLAHCADQYRDERNTAWHDRHRDYEKLAAALDAINKARSLCNDAIFPGGVAQKMEKILHKALEKIDDLEYCAIPEVEKTHSDRFRLDPFSTAEYKSSDSRSE